MFPVFFSWRLTVLLPQFYNADILDRMRVNVPGLSREGQFPMVPVYIDPTIGTEDEMDDNTDDQGSSEEDDEEDEDDAVIDDEVLNDMLAEYHNRAGEQ